MSQQQQQQHEVKEQHKHVLVTGGAGYIGTHTCVELIEAGYQLTIVDNFSNSSPLAMDALKEITGMDIPLHEVDLADFDAARTVFQAQQYDAVIHFAGLKAVGESVRMPLKYYDNNLQSTVNLLRLMDEFGCYNIVFSSSATVYGKTETVPIDESFPLNPTNPYGHTKRFIEQILMDLCVSDEKWTVYLLRYFNPVGAHISGLIGEDPEGIPNNLMPYISQVTVGKLAELSVFGDDYDTVDGTGVRDYIHVVDLAKGHIAALSNGVFQNEVSSGCHIYNLGTGNGYSVLQLVEAMRNASGQEIPYKIVERREGDVATCYADSSKALEELQWKAEKDIEDCCIDNWRWQSSHPKGFRSRAE